jgi:spore coat polysaccharide biosynthesis predicted glycosyltransferase SpsG
MGHVFRSSNIARVLQRKFKHEILFLTRDPIAKIILEKEFDCQLIQKKSIKKIKNVLQQFQPDLIVIDKLFEDPQTLRMLHQYSKILAIDYTGANKKMIEYGVNMLYPESGISNNRSFSGLKYSILNETFASTRPIHVRKKIDSVLVLQGGSDTECFTPKIISALNNINADFKVTVIIGPSFDCWSELDKVLRNNHKPIKILRNVKNMSSVMTKHDLAITGGGMTLLELTHLGIPSMVVCGAEFENETASLIQKKGCCINLGYGASVSEIKITKTAQKLLDDYHKRKSMNRIGKRLIDGKGADRVSQIINNIGRKN